MKRFHCFVIVPLLAALGAPASLWASTPADGLFRAERACEAYVSKNRRSNPDGARLEVGGEYPIFEVNRADDPDWFHLRVGSAEPAERWVEGACGRAEVSVTPSTSSNAVQRPVCDVAGEADSYVFAVSWQPAFCESHRDKPECRVSDPASYQATNFTLHGLWPNKSACGTGYGWCGEQKQIRGDFCQYPKLEMGDRVWRDLERVMPSAAAGSCLQRHEWYKHGTCQRLFTDDGYFGLATTLLEQFNGSGIGDFMAANVGGEVSVGAFRAAVDQGLGEGASERMKLICKGGNLVDIYINLPREIVGASLGALMARGSGGFSSNCGERFHIDRIGY